MSSSVPDCSLEKGGSALNQRHVSLDRPETPESIAVPRPVQQDLSTSSSPSISEEAGPQTTEEPNPLPYSAFSQSTKYLIVGIGAIAAIFSPISSNIFVPAIPTLASQFHRSESDISQALTIYLVFQATTPSLFGAMSDSFGRRPLYILILVIYFAANIGLALIPTSGYAALLVLRAVQSTGGSAVVAIGYGCVADVAEPRERGTFAAIFQTGALLGPTLGPLLGGILTQTLGWRSIFWFLVILTGVILVPLIFLLPETLRSLVGDGSIPPPPLNRTPIQVYQNHKTSKARAAAGLATKEVERPPRKPAISTPVFINALANPRDHPGLFLEFWSSLIYMEYYASIAPYSTALKDQYGFSEIKIGLCYLPCGFGTILSTILNGKQLDYYFRREERRVGGDYNSHPHTFNIERCRLYCFIPYTVVGLVAMTAQGWCLEAGAPLGALLVVNFFVGLGMGVVTTSTMYAQDICPNKGGAISASFNLVRCAFAAIGTATIQMMYETLNAGWTFVLLSGLVVVFMPFPLSVVRYGRNWREERERKEEGKKQRMEEEEKEKGREKEDGR
ncbi:hypothetical protein L202_02546 [Cryptococcus amylolentus CBS 6039]|uniref:Major facilitator superfamily (MFS) profile domain-containing protein n=1 Tax=Cryptococcus amylolentus CBS 6039 TaxID=1295533 RepID=A0A1E3I0Y8_9TREE|nr:hypothetical protein L202_02546 [Cryptococcus amylolentus CBS 6039]ODN82263.1 hypothetical protein L202_02546 [Cryptococcus amylolentus CBS 6039]